MSGVSVPTPRQYVLDMDTRPEPLQPKPLFVMTP
jgi:hypothetical protein